MSVGVGVGTVGRFRLACVHQWPHINLTVLIARTGLWLISSDRLYRNYNQIWSVVTILCSKYGRMQKKAFFKWTRLCITVKFCVRKAVFNYTAGGSIMDMSNTYALISPGPWHHCDNPVSCWKSSQDRQTLAYSAEHMSWMTLAGQTRTQGQALGQAVIKTRKGWTSVFVDIVNVDRRVANLLLHTLWYHLLTVREHTCLSGHTLSDTVYQKQPSCCVKLQIFPCTVNLEDSCYMFFPISEIWLWDLNLSCFLLSFMLPLITVGGEKLVLS